MTLNPVGAGAALVDEKPPMDKLGAVETGKAGVEVGGNIAPALDRPGRPPPKDIGADTEVEKGLTVEG